MLTLHDIVAEFSKRAISLKLTYENEFLWRDIF